MSLRRCPRCGAEFEQFTSLMASLEGYALPDIQDKWVWSLMGSGEFSVASVRRYIDDLMLLDVSSKTKWLKAVLIKVNIHAWKISTWWDFNLSEVSSFEEWRIWLSNIHLQGLRKEVLEGVFYIIWWLVWNFRNKLLFGKSIPLKATLFDDVVALLFLV
ncbi:hypothetical protein Tco_1136894 [Tanacetum coccineum]